MNKYHNKKKRCFSGHLHDSKGEADYCNSLLSQKQSGEVLTYLVQAVFDLPGGIRHIVDFYVLPKSTLTWEVHEYKGYQTAAWRLKKRLFEEKYPAIPYRVITNERRKQCRKIRLTGNKKILKRIRVWR